MRCLSPSSGDVVVTWTPSANAKVIVTLSLVESTITCGFDASAEKGIIPASLVQQAVSQRLAGAVDHPCSGTCSFLGFAALRGTETIAGDWLVSLTHTSASGIAAEVKPDP